MLNDFFVLAIPNDSKDGEQILLTNILKKIKNNIKKRFYNNNMSDKCIFKLTRGNRKGENCDKKTKPGCLYCSHHIPKQTPVNNENDEEKIEQKQEKKEEQKLNYPIYIIRKNKFGNFTFENTGLVFKSINDKRIVAREGQNGEWKELSDDDIELCKQYKLKYERIKFNRNFDSKQYTSNISLFDKPIKLEKELQSNNDLRFEENI